MNTIDCPRCKHEHEPIVSHEEDEGKQECQECGFKFNVEIEYDPDYITSCVECDYGPVTIVGGEMVVMCRHCDRVVYEGKAPKGLG